MVRAGEDIDSYCGKCRLTLAHVVIATDAGVAVRVQCKTCQSPHNHRAPKEKTPKKPAARTSRAKTEKAARGHAASFADAIEGRDISRAKRYAPKECLREGEVIDHPTFGLGVVSRLNGDTKAYIVFRDQERLLVHNLG